MIIRADKIYGSIGTRYWSGTTKSKLELRVFFHTELQHLVCPGVEVFYHIKPQNFILNTLNLQQK